MGHIQRERLPKSKMASSHDRITFEIVHVLRFESGLMNEWSAVSALRFCGRDEPIMKALEFCVLPHKQDFERIDTAP